MSNETQFLWGFLGSLAIEVVTAIKYFDASGGAFPARYRKVGYYVLRLVTAMIGGGLVIAYGIDKPILAMNIGAAAPMIIGSLAKKR